MALPKEPVVKKFFTNKIEKTKKISPTRLSVGIEPI